MSNYTQFRDTLYYVTPDGKVFSHYLVGGDNRFKKGRPSKNNHRQVGKGKCAGYHVVKPKSQSGWFIHAMVMECYGTPKPEGDYVIDHINEDKTDNNITNLQWLTRGENVAKGNKKRVPQLSCWDSEIR